ncbi:hypothetical protein SAMD00019534_054330 [Acytostelium subglobosum LB1]|uniref:hypothetical protein n=1 Tax=Acytostelium subglobosum LB1 TaxID=1410327 RepID=UPI000644AC75|nr:hypothetical protein SAMD00019534_054330 [Acytostelium subglobosum LB1]GAM22258.1 hypothetical protein SAMD00019534_054330 [Acytostelium subglobosum LB1]|eukprot:XP_012754378.1 hypothetical protein SAMD00019534_054330 [Acytostelium subglobosum LB1]
MRSAFGSIKPNSKMSFGNNILNNVNNMTMFNQAKRMINHLLSNNNNNNNGNGKLLHNYRMMTNSQTTAVTQQSNLPLLHRRTSMNGLNVNVGGQYRYGRYQQYNQSRSSRFFLSSNAVIWGLVAINGAIFFLWQDVSNKNQRFMYRNFTLSIENCRERPWTLITAAFSHKDFPHFIFNMLGLYTIGSGLVAAIGLGHFLSMYFGAAIFSSLVYCYIESQRGQQRRFVKTHGLGASGAVNAVVLAYAALFPHSTFLLMGILPMPAWLLVGGYLCYDFFQYQKKDQWAGGVHIAGALYGLIYQFFIRSKVL